MSIVGSGTNSTPNIDPLNLIRLASTVRDKIVFDGLLCVLFSSLYISLKLGSSIMLIVYLPTNS